jgi:hypothetical protein
VRFTGFGYDVHRFERAARLRTDDPSIPRAGLTGRLNGANGGRLPRSIPLKKGCPQLGCTIAYHEHAYKG